MKKNFNELVSKMSPEAQERAKARASELLREMDLTDLRRTQGSTEQSQPPAEDEPTPTSASNKPS